MSEPEITERQHRDETENDSSGPPATREEYVDAADGHEVAPEGFTAEFDVGDTQVPDEAVIVDVDGMGKASAYLVGWAVVEDMQDAGGEFGSTEVAQIIRDHYVSPSFENLHAEGVRNMKMAVPDALLSAIMPGMDTQMQADGTAQVDPAGNR